MCNTKPVEIQKDLFVLVCFRKSLNIPGRLKTKLESLEATAQDLELQAQLKLVASVEWKSLDQMMNIAFKWSMQLGVAGLQLECTFTGEWKTKHLSDRHSHYKYNNATDAKSCFFHVEIQKKRTNGNFLQKIKP